MFVCRPSPRLSRSLYLILFPNRSIIFWQSSPPLGRIGQFEANLFFVRASGLFSTKDFLPLWSPSSSNQRFRFFCTFLSGARPLFINLSVYTYMHLSRTRRGESIFLLSFQSCRAPFRSFHSRTGSSINHRISLTLSSSSFVARLQTSILRSRAC